MHRIWLCPVLEEARCRMVPLWLRNDVRRAIGHNGSMAMDKLALYTRALISSPEPLVTAAPLEESFNWVKRPEGGLAEGTIYIDGSLLHAEWRLANCCARRGWAFAAVDSNGMVTAAANGRPPAWCSGIRGAESWGLLMAAQAAAPDAHFRVDCLAVQQGAQRGQQWAVAPDRRLARAWAPVAMALGNQPSRVAWMPAHCGQGQIGVKQLSNGDFLSPIDRDSNALVDNFAKDAARADALPEAQRREVEVIGETLTAVAKWIGRSQFWQARSLTPQVKGSGGNATFVTRRAIKSCALGGNALPNARACSLQR